MRVCCWEKSFCQKENKKRNAASCILNATDTGYGTDSIYVFTF